MTNPLNDSLINALKKSLNLPEERIEGTTPDEAAEMVMLDVAFTPVIVHPVSEDGLMQETPEVCRVVKDGDRYCVYLSNQDWRWTTPDALKVMRARYLLVHGFYYKRMRLLCHMQRSQVISAFFPGGVTIPEPDSELGKAMGIL